MVLLKFAGSARYKYYDENSRTNLQSADYSSNTCSSSEIIASPSRELILQCISEYKRQDNCKDCSDSKLCERLERDMAPYNVLKLGGFSLGNGVARLLSCILPCNQTLRTLDLGFNRITDKGILSLSAALENNNSLSSLYLSGNDISAEGTRALACTLKKNKVLRSLHLSGNNIGEIGAQALADGLRVNTSLRSLYISTNGIGSVGMKALVIALQENEVLEELTLGQNKIGTEGLMHIANAFALGKLNLTTLDVGKNDIGTKGAIALANALCGQSNSSYSSSTLQVENRKQYPIEPSQNRLQNLYLDNNPIGDVGAGVFGMLLTRNNTIRVLDLSYTQMSLIGLKDLCIGIKSSQSLLCLLLDGHDWSSTKYMSKARELLQQGISLSAKSANQFAATSVIKAVQANANSVLSKITGVDLGIIDPNICNNAAGAIDVGHSGNHSRQERCNDASFTSSSESCSRSLDVCTRNEIVLEQIKNKHRTPDGALLHKRKANDEDRCDSNQAKSSAIKPPSQKQKLETDMRTHLPLGIVPKLRTSGLNEDASPTAAQDNAASIAREEELGIILKTPRYQAISESQVRKIIRAIEMLPFEIQEYKKLYRHYLVEPYKNDSQTAETASAVEMTESVRFAKYPATLALWHKRRDEHMRNRDSLRVAQGNLKSDDHAQTEEKHSRNNASLIMLRQLHYLVKTFQHIEDADKVIYNLLLTHSHNPFS